MTDPTSRLEALRAAAIERLATARAELGDVLDSASSTTGDDEHDPEGATIGFERAQAQASVDAALARLNETDAAIDRAAAGIYGVCVVCLQPISAERLDARPATPYCVACSR
jgi:DnaK suppressor protein